MAKTHYIKPSSPVIRSVLNPSFIYNPPKPILRNMTCNSSLYVIIERKRLSKETTVNPLSGVLIVAHLFCGLGPQVTRVARAHLQKSTTTILLLSRKLNTKGRKSISLPAQAPNINHPSCPTLQILLTRRFSQCLNSFTLPKPQQ